MLGKRIGAVVMACVLAVTLNPAAAFASPLSAGEMAQQPKQVETQAAKKTVYVLASITDVSSSTVVEGYTGKSIKQNEKKVVKFTYNKNGLLTKSNYTSAYQREGMRKQTGSAQRQWKYNKNSQLIQVKRGVGTAKLTLDKNGKMTKAVADYGYTKDTMTFAYKSGKVASMKSVQKGSYSQTKKETYGYSSGKLASLKNSNSTRLMSYDKKGNLTSGCLKGQKSVKFAGTYDTKGLLTKRYRSTYSKTSPTGEKRTITYKYKAVKVDNKVASKIKVQQWALLNDNLNFALGPWIGYGYMNATNNFN